MADEDPKTPAVPEPPKTSAIELSKRIRMACAIGGGLAVVFAGVVLWRGVDGAATVSFVALAALLLLLAVGGFVPRRIKSGDHEVELTRDAIEETKNKTDEIIASSTDAEIEQLQLRASRELAQSVSSLKAVTAARLAEAVAFENSTRSNVEFVATGRRLVFMPVPKDLIEDFRILDDNGTVVARGVVWFKFNPSRFKNIKRHDLYQKPFIVLIPNLGDLDNMMVSQISSPDLGSPKIVVCEPRLEVLDMLLGVFSGQIDTKPGEIDSRHWIANFLV